MNIHVDPTSSNLASAMLNLKKRPRAVVGYGINIFHPSPPNYVTRSPGLWCHCKQKHAGRNRFLTHRNGRLRQEQGTLSRVRSLWVGACNSYTKPKSRHFYRLTYLSYALTFVKERQFRSCDWSWYSYGSLIPGKFDLKIHRIWKRRDRNIVDLHALTHQLLRNSKRTRTQRTGICHRTGV